MALHRQEPASPSVKTIVGGSSGAEWHRRLSVGRSVWRPSVGQVRLFACLSVLYAGRSVRLSVCLSIIHARTVSVGHVVSRLQSASSRLRRTPNRVTWSVLRLCLCPVDCRLHSTPCTLQSRSCRLLSSLGPVDSCLVTRQGIFAY